MRNTVIPRPQQEGSVLPPVLKSTPDGDVGSLPTVKRNSPILAIQVGAKSSFLRLGTGNGDPGTGASAPVFKSTWKPVTSPDKALAVYTNCGDVAGVGVGVWLGVAGG